MQPRTLVCPYDSRYSVVLDAAEMCLDDPGQGTPAMVYGPRNASGTYFRAVDSCELDEDVDPHEIPPSVHRWLSAVDRQVDDYINQATMEAEAHAA